MVELRTDARNSRNRPNLVGFATSLGMPSWYAEAECAKPDLEVTEPPPFYPKAGDNGHRAKAVCAGCPVQTKCLAWALEKNEVYGIWGGLTEVERRKLRLKKAS